MLQNLKNINILIGNISLSQLEKHRLNNDLGVVFDRMRKSEYLMTDFTTDNKFNIPDRTKEFFKYLDSYCDTGKTIAKVLKKLKVNKYKTAVDLCSGWAPKVTLGFYYARYKGNVILLDKDTKSSSKLVKFMKLFLLDYKLEKVGIDLFGKFDFKSQFIVANHIIDDLIVSHYSNKYNFDISTLYHSEKNLLKCWKNILELGKDFEDEIVEILSKLLDNLLLKDGIIIISQYQSMIEYLLEMTDVTKFNKDVLYRVKQKLLDTGKYSDLSEISYQVLTGKKEAFQPSECIILKKI